MGKKELDSLLSWTDYGHVFLKRGYEDESCIAWGSVGENLWQEVSVMWDNYPVLGVALIEKTEQELIDLILNRYLGWCVVRNHLEELPTHDGGDGWFIVSKEED